MSGNERYYLDIRLQMEVFICEREGMLALNQWRESRGEPQAYSEESFQKLANEFNGLIERIRNI